MRVLDLHHAISGLTAVGITNRSIEMASQYNGAYLIAIGGFPIVKRLTGGYDWCDGDLTPFRIQDQILKGLGASILPLIMNYANESRYELGQHCLRKRAGACNWMPLSFLFVDQGLKAEIAMVQDGRFHLSWPLTTNNGLMFVATTSLKEWLRFTTNADDEDLNRARGGVASILQEVVPRIAGRD